MFHRLKPRLERRSVLKKRIVYYNTVSNTWNSLLTNKIAWIFFFVKGLIYLIQKITVNS